MPILPKLLFITSAGDEDEVLPEDAVVEKATAILRARGWQIQVHYFNSAGCRAGSVTMMPPDSVGF